MTRDNITRISLMEAIKRYSNSLTIDQIITLRQFERDFLYTKVKVEPGMAGAVDRDPKDADKLSLEIYIT